MTTIYQPKYSNSWAIVIGINNYQYVNPLGFACNDANAVASLLIEEFEFPPDNVVLLLDEKATKANIMREFLKYANCTEIDDRIFFFYAGHGHTMRGNRGEVGYLIPFDGKLEDISTFIRWDDLTRNSELFQAKHALFVMDACYGGLAITRSLQPGSTRFLKDMLRRYTRQVLTAGKADEVVADAGGPLPGHSIFTGHLIEALRGKAAQPDGTITANGVMSYVYEKVSKDQYSNQTPHFGYFEGDGDFIFKAPTLTSLKEGKEEVDQMIVIQPVYSGREQDDDKLIEEVKEYLSEERYYIKLDDLINRELRKAMSLFSSEFSLQGNFSNEEFIERLKKYENFTRNIRNIVAAVSYWGTSRYVTSLKKIISRLSDLNDINSGLVVWLRLRWYPLLLSLYAGGISAVASENYEMLAALFLTKITNERRDKNQEIIRVTISELTEIYDVFKVLPGHERNYVPRSEYLFKLLQPSIDDLFFLGKSYESIFDRFEILLALVYADVYETEGYHIWGPPGRFAWKHRSYDNSPLTLLIKEAETLKSDWPPLKAGLFNGSYDRFKQIADEYVSLIAKLSWY